MLVDIVNTIVQWEGFAVLKHCIMQGTKVLAHGS